MNNYTKIEKEFIKEHNKLKFNYKLTKSIRPELLSEFKNELDIDYLLRNACRHNDFEFFKVLIDIGGDINTKSLSSDSILSIACQSNGYEIAKTLIELGADIESRNLFGNTALILTCLSNKTRCAKLLIDSGANVNAENENDGTALDFAVINENKELAEYIRKKQQIFFDY